MYSLKNKLSVVLVILVVLTVAVCLFSCSDDQKITADATVKYLTEEDYLSGDIDGRLKDSLEITFGQKGYAVIDLTLSKMKNITEKAKGTVTVKFTSTGENDFSYKIEEFPTGDYTEENNTVTSEFRIRSGEEKTRSLRFIVSVSKPTTGKIHVSFRFTANSQTTAVNGETGRLGKSVGGDITVSKTVKAPSKLEFAFSSDGSYYTVVGVGGESGETIDIPDTYNGLPVKEIAPNTFNNVTYLKEVTLPAELKKIGDGAFKGCTALEKVVIPISVTEIGENAFDNCSVLSLYCEASAKPSGWKNNFAPSGTYVSWKYSRSFSFKLTEKGDSYCLESAKGAAGDLVIPDKYLKLPVTEIASEAFKDCDKLTGITLPDSVTAVGSEAFANTGVYNKSANWVSGELYIGNILIAIKYPVSGSYTVKSGTKGIGGGVFKGFSGLTNVTLPDSVLAIGDYAFSGCTKLTAITVPEKVTYIGGFAFENCDTVTEINVPNSVTTLGKKAFSSCDKLKYVTIGDGVTLITTHMFLDCVSLDTVRLGEGVTKIEPQSLHGCLKVSMVIMPGAKWYCSTKDNATSGIEVSNNYATTNADNLSFKYQMYYWYRK